MTGASPVLACIIDAIPKEQRPLHQANIERLFTSIQEVRVLETGYAWQLPNEMNMLQTLVTFIGYERLCCPFFYFKLEVEPEPGPIWFSITGAIDVKEFLQREGIVLLDNVPTSEGA